MSMRVSARLCMHECVFMSVYACVCVCEFPHTVADWDRIFSRDLSKDQQSFQQPQREVFHFAGSEVLGTLSVPP